MEDITEAGSAISIIESMRTAGDDVRTYYEMMENAGWLEHRYYDFMTTAPIDVTEELKRLPTADFHLCCALMTMLLREDHFCNGAFEHNIANGCVDRILSRMKMLQMH